MIILNSCGIKSFSKTELLITYRMDNNNKPYLSDSIFKYYSNGKLIKTLSPAFKTYMGEKSVSTTVNIMYDKSGKIIKKYSYGYWPNDSEPKNYLNDSVSFEYANQKLILKTDYLHKIDDQPKQTSYLYKNEKLVTEFEIKRKEDSISIQYPTNQIIEKTYFVRGELCYKEKISIISKNDTLTSIDVNRSSKYCGFNSDKSFRRVYNSKNQLELTILEKSNNSKTYSFYKNGNMIKICNDSIQKSCDITYEYEFDKNDNWINRIEKKNGKTFEIQKRIINY